MDGDKTSVTERLEAYNQRFEALLDMLRGNLPLRGESKAQAQALLKSLKGDLEAEYRKMSTVRGRQELTEIETAYYYPTIHQTFAEISVATNTIPDGKWHSNLYGAKINITHTLHQLRADTE